MCEYCENTFSNKRNKNIMEGELKTFTGVPLCKYRTYLDVNQFDNTPELKTDLFTYENYTEPENGTKLRELVISGGFQTIKYCPFCGEFLGRKTRTIVEFRENEKNLIRPATDEELDEIENDKNWIRCFNRANQQVLPFIKRMEKCIDMARRDGRIYLDNIVDMLGFSPIKDGYNGYDAYAYWEYEEFKNIICCLDGTLVLPQPHSLRPKNPREENSEKSSDTRSQLSKETEEFYKRLHESLALENSVENSGGYIFGKPDKHVEVIDKSSLHPCPQNSKEENEKLIELINSVFGVPEKED